MTDMFLQISMDFITEELFPSRAENLIKDKRTILDIDEDFFGVSTNVDEPEWFQVIGKPKTKNMLSFYHRLIVIDTCIFSDSHRYMYNILRYFYDIFHVYHILFLIRVKYTVQ